MPSALPGESNTSSRVPPGARYRAANASPGGADSAATRAAKIRSNRRSPRSASGTPVSDRAARAAGTGHPRRTVS